VDNGFGLKKWKSKYQLALKQLDTMRHEGIGEVLILLLDLKNNKYLSFPAIYVLLYHIRFGRSYKPVQLTIHANRQRT
jgi:hypothetical protein